MFKLGPKMHLNTFKIPINFGTDWPRPPISFFLFYNLCFNQADIKRYLRYFGIHIQWGQARIYMICLSLLSGKFHYNISHCAGIRNQESGNLQYMQLTKGYMQFLLYILLSWDTAVFCIHDDVITWKRFLRHRPFVRRIHQWSVDSLHK